MAQRDVHGAQGGDTTIQLGAPDPVALIPTTVCQTAANPVADLVKAVGASPLMLITSIVAFLGVLLQLYKVIQSFQIQFSVLSVFGVDLVYIALACIALGLSLLPCTGLWFIFINSKRALGRPVPYRIGGAIFIKVYCIIVIVLASLALLLAAIIFTIVFIASAALSAGGDVLLGIIVALHVTLLLGVSIIIYFAKIVRFLGNAQRTVKRGAVVKGSMYVVVMNAVMSLVLVLGVVVRIVVDRFIKQVLGELMDYLQSFVDISLDLYVRSAIDFGLTRLLPSSGNAMAIIETVVCVVFLICVSLLILKYKRTVTRSAS